MKKVKKLFIIFLILGLSFPANSENIKIRQFGGLNTRINPYNIKEDESPDTSNFVLDEAGTIKERALWKHYNSISIGTNPFTNLYKFYKSSDVGYFIATAGTLIYSVSTGTLTGIVTNNVVVSGTQWDFESFTDGSNELVFAANNGTALLSWNGTDTIFKDKGGHPAQNCNLLKKHKSRLFAAGSTEYPYRLYYSSLSDGTNWTKTGGTMDLPSYEKIMKLEVLSDILYIFTRQAIYALYGDSPNEFTLQKTLSVVGTHAAKSVQLGERLIFFLNKSGVFAFDGVQSVNISEPIQPTIDAISNTYLDKSAALYDKRGRYWLAYTSTNGTYNDKILVYDTVVKQWYLLDGLNVGTFYKTEGGSDKGEIYTGSSDAGGWLWQLATETTTEQLVYYTRTQLESGVTSNTVFQGSETSPIVELNDDSFNNGEYYNSNLDFYLKLDGTDESTTFTDTTGNHTFTAASNAQLDTACYKIGTASLKLDGVDDYISSADHTDWDIQTGNATWRFWAKTDTTTFADTYMSLYSIKYTASNFFTIYINNSGVLFVGYQNAGVETSANTSPTGCTVTNWNYYEVVKVNLTWYLFINGVLLTTKTLAAQPPNMSSGIWIGRDIVDNNKEFSGWIDQYEYSGDTALYTSTHAISGRHVSDGTLTSDNIEINASGQSSLGAITWNESLSSNTDIQFTTRTAVTDDTTYDTWTEPWVSTSTVVMQVTDPTVWISSDLTNFWVTAPSIAQQRYITYYETDDSPSPNTVGFNATGVLSTDDYADCTISPIDLSSYKWIGYWLKSPATGNSVKLDIGEVSGTSVAYNTANTVDIDTWEYHYFPLDSISDSDLNSVTYLKLTYLGEMSGVIYLGDIYAYDFYDSGETITSTPNDYIQYKAILGTTDHTVTPKLVESNSVVVSLSYSAGGATEELSLTSSWKSKIFSNDNESNKLWKSVEFTMKSKNPTTNHTVELDWYTDDGARTGTLTKNIPITDTNVKVEFFLPSGTWGKDFQFKIRDTDIDDDLEIRNATINFSQEANE